MTSPTRSELFSALHRGTEGDLDFYKHLCSDSESVLELGSGYGRVALALAETGCEVTGLEKDRELLALARHSLLQVGPEARERANFIHGDMRSFSLDRHFDRILIPFNGIYCLTTEEEQLACLVEARKHLDKDGLLLFDGYDADAFHKDALSSEASGDFSEDEWGSIATVCVRDQEYEVWEQSRHYKDTQYLEARYLYKPSEGKDVEITIPQRYLCKQDIESLVSRAGLCLKKIQEGFETSSNRKTAEPASCWVAIAGA